MKRALTLALLSPWGWLAAWAAAAVVTTVLYLSPQTAPPGDYHADKLIHLAVFFALGLPLRRAALRPAGLAVLVAVNVALALGLEMAQAFVPGRQFGLFDIVANMLGLAGGVVAGSRIEAALIGPGRAREAAFPDGGPARATRAK